MDDVYVKQFSQLTTNELFDIYKLRVAVFVVEQKCYYQEVDDDDKISYHLMFKDARGQLTAYARIIPEENRTVARIGRVVVDPQSRGGGHGRRLVDQALAQIPQLMPKASKIVLAGQQYLNQFYQSFGFKNVSDVYLEDGIPHIDMEKLI
ncbi:putative acyltransferase [Lentilactobacillus parabuchneri]|nr:GNAT family N-acetyltransferase [Lentilactobacillus parabuchneri]APR07715.1 putative acyltransferase [Lentilactobacillus parabuchneri]MBW0222309.1 GNAT family N-acetyltransferase [Lentilactobacillus parabuchneri]MBW0245454.1 GNAT family N-acetyltransferase [Lentilactobacillus parabuchneri]MBW0263522.1 GNAT family N-acetyltransferase [Lentilactobacillus parabuchneri]MCT2885575.1 GNAT family N-acetyltransferase [Lentilactobacillus parabuchneri]